MKQRVPFMDGVAKLSLLLALVLAAAALAPASQALAAAAAPAAASSLGNYVWLDANGNGWHDQAGDGPEAEFTAGINGVQVNLYLDANKNGVIDPGELQATTTTDATGYYLFPGITANGNWFIVEIDPSNYGPTGALAGHVLTSGTTYGSSPMLVKLNDIAINYVDADFGYIPSPLKISKTVLTTTQGIGPYVAPGDSVTFRIMVQNTSSSFTIDPAPLDDFYTPACLQFVSATIAPTTVDAANGWLHWANIGPIGPGATVTVDVTFTAVDPNPAAAPSGMLWKEGGWKDYAPKGIPDFDQRQANWDNPLKSGAGWYMDGPVAMADSLWWFDSKFEPGSTPPPTISDGYPLIKAYNPFTPTVKWDDHDARNVPPLVNNLGTLMGAAPGAGTTPTGVANGVTQFIANAGLAGKYTITTQAKPTFQWVGDEVRASEDVVLLLGFWQEPVTGGAPVRVGGHYVTSAGIDLLNSKIGLSDPIRNAAEGAAPASGAGRVLPGMHSNHPASVGASGDAVHNDAQYISQDVYANGQLSALITAGNWGLTGYVDANPATGCSEVAGFQGQNTPSEFSSQQGPCSANGGSLWTVVEYAVAVSPTMNTPMCSPTTNIAAVTDAEIPGTQTTLPPVQDETRVTEGRDFGDLADTPYPTRLATDGARHLITSPLRLGTLLDTEANGQPSLLANGDDVNNLADEDGVTVAPGKAWQDGTTASGNGGALQITISGGTGVPQVFMDFGPVGTGPLQPITLRDSLGNPLSTSAWAPGTYTVYFDIPAGTMAPGPTIHTRVRLSSAGGLAATGAAPDGEVEDYAWGFVPTAVSVEALSATQTGSLGAALVFAVLLVAALAGWRTLTRRVERNRGSKS